MTRTLAVVLIAALCAALFGVDRPSWAAQTVTPLEAAERQAVRKRLASIKINSPVKIERVDGTTVQGFLAEKRADDISVDIYRRRAFRRPQLVRRETIRLDDVKDIKKLLSDKQKNAIGATVAAGILLGTCAIALSQYHASLSPQANPSDAGIDHDVSSEKQPLTDPQPIPER